MTEITEAIYDAAIPECCSIRGVQAHTDELMLCWKLVEAIGENKPMDCSGCDLKLPTTDRGDSHE